MAGALRFQLVGMLTGIEITPGPRWATGFSLTMPWASSWARPPKSATAARSTKASRWAEPRSAGRQRHPTLGKNVVVSAGAKVLGGFIVGDDAKSAATRWSSNPCPRARQRWAFRRALFCANRAKGDVATPDPKLSAYGITNEDDPFSQALRGLVSSATTHDHQIALLCKRWRMVRTGKWATVCQVTRRSKSALRQRS